MEPLDGQEHSITLPPEQMEMVRQAMESFERGEGYSAEEVLEYSRAKVKVWLPNPNQSA
jgi:hypothetical protein